MAGRPMAHLAISDLERTVTGADGNSDELTLVLAELGYRKSKRANALHDLVTRLIDERHKMNAPNIGPLFD